MLLDQDAALRAAELVDDSMFYREAHRRLFRAMRALIERRSVIEICSLVSGRAASSSPVGGSGRSSRRPAACSTTWA